MRMFKNRVNFIHSTTTDVILYRRFIYRYGYKLEYLRFCYGRKLDPNSKSAMYKFLVSRDLVKWFNLDHKLGLADDTIFDIAKVRWL